MKYKGAGDPMSYDDVLALVKTYITKEETELLDKNLLKPGFMLAVLNYKSSCF